jgi:predicted amidohydrolase YtcJ
MMNTRLDLIIENVDVVTMDPGRASATAVGISGGRIVGLDDDLAGCTATERVDGHGGTLLPGFIDAHTHLELTGQALTAISIAGCADPRAALAAIAAESAGRPADAWVEVGGYDHRVFGRHLTATELDAAGGGRKVWVRQISGHASVVSTAVLAAAETAAAGTDAAASAFGSRMPDGLLEELEQDLVRRQRLPYPLDELAEVTLVAAEQARRQGITFCMDAGNGGQVGSLSAVDGAAYQNLLDSGRLPVRIQLMPSIDVLHRVDSHRRDGFTRGIDLGVRTGFGSDRLHLGAQKVVLDGGMQVGTARMTDPYHGSTNMGAWRQDPDEMVEAIIDGHCAGWQMAVHAIGDLAVDLALTAFGRAQRARPRADARHRIEHGGAIRDDQLRLLKQLGIAVVSQPSFLYDYGDEYHELMGPDRSDWLYRGRSLLDNGIRLVGSTDRPLPGSPLRAVQTLAERRTRSGRTQSPADRCPVRRPAVPVLPEGPAFPG